MSESSESTDSSQKDSRRPSYNRGESTGRHGATDRFLRLCEVVPLAVLETDIDENLLYANPRWEEISGSTPVQSEGTGWQDAIHSEDQEWVLEECTLARGQKRMFDADFRLNRPDGKVCWVHGNSLPLYSEGEWHDGYLHMIYDISDRKLIEQTLRDSVRETKNDILSERGVYSAAASQVSESIADALEQTRQLLDEDASGDLSKKVEDLRKCLDLALSACESLPAVESQSPDEAVLDDILF